MATDRPAPPGVDTSTPNVARMWDYYLGGKDNFAADREAAERVLTMVPELRIAARAHREFLTRVVQRLTAAGIRQFIDIGSGLPTQGNVHEIAQAQDPEARVIYADYDPVVCAHGRALLEQSDGVAVVQADLRHPDEILDDPDVRSLIDFNQPVAVLLVAIVHFLTDEDDPAAIIGRFRDAMASGSYLALTHGTAESMPNRDLGVETILNVYNRSTAPLIGRSREEIMRLFDGLELIDPGLVWLIEWGAPEPVEQPERSLTYAGVGRKP
ncbi:MAG: SAM-dependent methyltransferase [Actinomycetota bacterium]